jgi:hypothetical protein
MNLEDIMLSEISQSQKDKYGDSTSVRYIQKVIKFTDSRMVVSRS